MTRSIVGRFTGAVFPVHGAVVVEGVNPLFIVDDNLWFGVTTRLFGIEIGHGRGAKELVSGVGGDRVGKGVGPQDNVVGDVVHSRRLIIQRDDIQDTVTPQIGQGRGGGEAGQTTLLPYERAVRIKDGQRGANAAAGRGGGNDNLRLRIVVDVADGRCAPGKSVDRTAVIGAIFIGVGKPLGGSGIF